MSFRDILTEVVQWLQQDTRVSYGALKREFELDDDYVEDLKEGLLYVYEPSVQADERGIRWTGMPSIEPRRTRSVRRKLTVMFVDLVDSTSLSGDLDAAEMRDVLNAYHAACTSVINNFKGYVAQHLGDGLLCYFGYPRVSEDDAARAVRTGLGIIEKLRTINARVSETYGIRLAVRISVHTGAAVVGTVGAGERREQLAFGKTPNVAARLKGLADPDTVVISAATRRLIDDHFECVNLGEHRLNGLSDVLDLYRVLGSREGIVPSEAPGSAVREPSLEVR